MSVCVCSSISESGKWAETGDVVTWLSGLAGSGVWEGAGSGEGRGVGRVTDKKSKLTDFTFL